MLMFLKVPPILLYYVVEHKHHPISTPPMQSEGESTGGQSFETSLKNRYIMDTKKKSTSSTALATSVLRPMDAKNIQILDSLKVRFVTGSKNGVKLIVQKAGQSEFFAVYMFKESLEYGDIHAGDMITVLAEYRQSKANGEWYWNATAVSKE